MKGLSLARTPQTAPPQAVTASWGEGMNGAVEITIEDATGPLVEMRLNGQRLTSDEIAELGRVAEAFAVQRGVRLRLVD